MFTLKIRWTRHETKPVETPTTTGGSVTSAPEFVTANITSLEDETTLFIPADLVKVHGFIGAGERAATMRSWDEHDAEYLNYLSVNDGSEMHGRLICVEHANTETWYLATHAWVLGPDGGTIERVT